MGADGRRGCLREPLAAARFHYLRVNRCERQSRMLLVPTATNIDSPAQSTQKGRSACTKCLQQQPHCMQHNQVTTNNNAVVVGFLYSFPWKFFSPALCGASRSLRTDWTFSMPWS